jgi:hypothetical protein
MRSFDEVHEENILRTGHTYLSVCPPVHAYTFPITQRALWNTIMNLWGHKRMGISDYLESYKELLLMKVVTSDIQVRLNIFAPYS